MSILIRCIMLSLTPQCTFPPHLHSHQMHHAFADAPLYLSARLTRTCVEFCSVYFVVYAYGQHWACKFHDLLLQLVCPLLLLMAPTCSVAQN